MISDPFTKESNQIILAKQVAINAILGIGMTFVILTGGIDLSVGSIVGLTGMIAGGLINEGLVLEPLNRVVYFNVWIVGFLAILVGMFVGLINGILITRFNVAPFIATLGTLYMARGFALLRNDGATFPNLIGKPELHNTGFRAARREQSAGAALLDLDHDRAGADRHVHRRENAVRAAGFRHWRQRARGAAFRRARQVDHHADLRDQRLLRGASSG